MPLTGEIHLQQWPSLRGCGPGHLCASGETAGRAAAQGGATGDFGAGCLRLCREGGASGGLGAGSVPREGNYQAHLVLSLHCCPRAGCFQHTLELVVHPFVPWVWPPCMGPSAESPGVLSLPTSRELLASMSILSPPWSDWEVSPRARRSRARCRCSLAALRHCGLTLFQNWDPLAVAVGTHVDKMHKRRPEHGQSTSFASRRALLACRRAGSWLLTPL